MMQLWEKDPVAANVAIKLHDAISRRYLPAYYGFELSTEGGEWPLSARPTFLVSVHLNSGGLQHR